ncbi:MAG: hypothetical protein KDD60_08725, partial [Bdellovibrionales bacterium]|nr:hypothetical protein [Bdellovibrionales bacterium]
LEAAETQYRIAELSISDDSHNSETRYALFEGLGVTLMNRGKYDQAEHYLLQALNYTSNSESAAHLNLKIGELRIRTGDVINAAKAIEHGLVCLGEADQSQLARRLLGLPFYVFAHTIRCMIPRSLNQRLRSKELSPRKRLIMQLHNRLAYAYWFLHGSYRSMLPHYRSLYIGESHRPSLELLHAYTGHGLILSVIGFHRDAIRYCDMAQTLQDQVGDQWSAGQYRNFYGVIEFGITHYRECLELCGDAAIHLGAVGDLWEYNVANSTMAFALYSLGNLSDSHKLILKSFERCRDIGDYVNQALLLQGWSMATLGNAPEEEITRVLARAANNDFQAHVECLLAQTYNRLYRREYRDALEHAKHAQSLFKGRVISLSYIQTTLPTLAMSWRLYLESLDSDLNGTSSIQAKKKEGRKEWKRAVQLALIFSHIYPNHRPHALREAAFYEAKNSRGGAARKRIQQSILVAHQHGAKFELALSLLAYSLMSRRFGWEDADNLREDALQILRRESIHEEAVRALLEAHPQETLECSH